MDIDVKKARNTRLLSRNVHRPFRAKGQDHSPPCTIIQQLNHSCFVGRHQGLLVSACTFAIHDDSVLITQTTFPGSNRAQTFKAGFIQSWDLTDLSEPEHDDSLFTYAPRPEFSMNGGIISTILNSGKGVLILAEVDEDSTLEPCKFECVSKFGSDNLSARAKSCVFSPDGRLVVTISIVLFNALLGQQYHDMCLWRLGKERVLQKCFNIRCENQLPGFSGEAQSCVFSPDSSLLALTTTDSQLYVLKSNNLEVFAVIRSTRSGNNYCFCMFDPCESATKLNVALSNGVFQIWKLSPGNICCVTEKRLVSLGDGRLTSMAYTLDHSLLALGTTAGDVIIYETESYIQLCKLNPNDAVDEENSLQVCSVAFAKSCQELAVG